jgi:B12 binding domain
VRPSLPGIDIIRQFRFLAVPTSIPACRSARPCALATGTANRQPGGRAGYPEDRYQLFKDPHVLLDALRAEPPDILALSHYFWNTKLNHRIARYARELYPDIVIVTGGPNLDRNEAAYRAYAEEHPYVDYVVTEEGETAFANVLAVTNEGAAMVGSQRTV